MPEPHKCSSCGATLPPDVPSGLCAACVAAGLPTGGETITDLGATKTKSPSFPLTEKPGDHIGRYKLLEQVGEGGCGVVYVAEQTEPVHRRVALKVIKLGMDTRQVIARFEAERQALALMDHPNIAKVLDAGATDAGRPFFVMELVKGVRITDYCDRNNLSTTERLGLFVQVCQAIQHAHQKGIIHRDIKPSNILVTLHDGVPVPKVIDFGIAKATTGQRLTDKTLYTAIEQFIGTPAYMSPEQAELSGLDIDTRSDVYALGVLLYELLTGKTPFDAKRLIEAGLDEIRRIIREEEPLRPSTRLGTLTAEEQTTTAKRRRSEPPKLIHIVRGDLDWIVMKTLEKDRTRRYETANGLAMDIQRHLNNEPVVARPPSQFYRFQKLVRRNKLAVAAAVMVALSLIAGLGLFAWEYAGKSKALNRVLSAEKAAKVQAERADRNAAEEAAQRRRAEASALESRNTLADSDFLEATRHIAEDRGPTALAHLQRSLSLNATNSAALLRLATLLTEHTWMLPMLSLRHSNAVLCAEFSPDGKKIVTGSYAGRVTAMVRDAGPGRRYLPPGPRWIAQVWDAQTGERLTKPLEHVNFLQSAQFSPDGKVILTTASDAPVDGAVRLWDAASGEPLAVLQHSRGVRSAQFSPDGQRVFTVGNFGAQVWDAHTGQPQTKPLQHSVNMSLPQFSPDGKWIVTLEGKKARVWDAQTSQPVAEAVSTSGWYFTSAQFSPDGKRFVTASYYQAQVWDAQTGRPLAGPFTDRDGLGSVQFSPDGRKILTISAGGARVWDAQTAEPLSEPLKHSGVLVSAEFSGDGQRVLTASADGTARVWDAQSGTPLTELLKLAGAIKSARFSPDGRWILTASDDGMARLWDIRRGKALGELFAGSRGGFYPQQVNLGGKNLAWDSRRLSGQFGPDGKRVLVVSQNHAQVWDARTGLPSTGPMKSSVSLEDMPIVSGARGGGTNEPIRTSGELRAGQLSPDGKRVVTASTDGTAQVWDAQTGRPMTGPMKHPGPVNFAQFSPDGRRIITGSGDMPGVRDKSYVARVWDAQTGQRLSDFTNHFSEVNAAQFSPDGKRVVSVSGDSTAWLWDAQTGQPLSGPWQLGGSGNSVQFSPDGECTVISSFGGEAQVRNAQTGEALIEPLKHSGLVATAQFSPDGQRIVTASWDGTARVWDAKTGQPVTEPLRHSGAVNSAQFSPDGRRILTSSTDGTARVWDVQTGQQLTEPLKHTEPLLSAQFSPDAGRVVTVAEWGTAWVWDIAPPPTNCPGWLLELAGALSNPLPTHQGASEHAAQDPLEVTTHVRQALQDAPQDEWTRWGRWFLADRSTRPIAPCSDTTVPQYIEGRLDEATNWSWGVWDSARRSLAEAEALAVGDAELMGRIAEIRGRLDLISSGYTNAEAGNWKDALAAYSKIVELEPANPKYHYELAQLLAQTGDREAYDRHCQQVIALFAGTKDSRAALVAALSCLVLPPPDGKLAAISGLAETVAASETNHNSFGEFARGLAEYRQQRLDNAINWAQAVLSS